MTSIMKKIIFTIGALLIAIAIGLTLYEVLQAEEEAPQFEWSQEKARPADLLEDLLEKTDHYKNYILNSDYLSLSIDGDQKLALHSAQNEEDARFSISHHFHELTDEEDLLIGTYEKIEEGTILEDVQGAFFKDRDGGEHFFEYTASADEDRLPIHVQGYDEEALAKADLREEAITKAELEDNLGLAFSDIKMLDQDEVDMTAHMLTVETGLMDTVNVIYKGIYEGEEVLLSVQAMPGEMDFDDNYEKMQNVYVQDQLDQPVYYWQEDGLVYNLQLGQLDDLFTHKEIVALIQYMTEPIQ